MIKQGISREGRLQRVLVANTSKTSEKSEDHLVEVVVDKVNLYVILDGGANCNLISSNFLSAAQRKRIEKTKFSIRTALENILEPEGIIKGLSIIVNGNEIKIDKLVVKGVAYQMILGKPFFKSTNAVTLWNSDEYLFSFVNNQCVFDCKRSQKVVESANNVFRINSAHCENDLRKIMVDEFQDL